jgi:hypothetical protein
MIASCVTASRTRQLIALLAVVSSAVLSSAQATSPVSVTTWHNDNWRTGQNTSETILKPNNVGKATFGKICSASVDGQVYSQPLEVGNLTIKGTTYPAVVYVVTENDSVYAFNGTNCQVLLGPVSLLQSGEAPADCHFIGGGGCKTIAPAVGVLGTPVIDPATQTLYLSAESQFPASSPTTWFHRIHALDITTLAEKYNGPVVVSGSVSSGKTFNPQEEIQRPGLLLPTSPVSSTSVLYIAYSMMDGAPDPHPPGWVFAYDAKNLSDPNFPKFYATTPVVNPPAEGGGIWQGGGGLAIGRDENGQSYLYFSTGDGTFDLTSTPLTTQDAGDTFIKMTPDLNTIAGYFTPSDQYWRACNDIDFGSGGVLLVPDNTLPNYPYIAIKGDKEGIIWAFDRGSPGGYNGGSCSQSCTARCMNSNNNLQSVADLGAKVIHNNPAFWKGSSSSYLYYAVSFEPLAQYPLCNTNGPICTGINYLQSGNTFQYGSTPSVSSQGTTNGIVWSIDNFGNVSGGKPAVLWAYDAVTLNTLYNSTQCPTRDTPGDATKFSVPTIANGFVYFGTQTDFDIYGNTTAACN